MVTPDTVSVFCRVTRLARKHSYVLGLFCLFLLLLFLCPTLSKDHSCLGRGVALLNSRYSCVLPVGCSQDTVYMWNETSASFLEKFHWALLGKLVSHPLPHRLPYKLGLSKCQFEQLEKLQWNTQSFFLLRVIWELGQMGLTSDMLFQWSLLLEPGWDWFNIMPWLVPVRHLSKWSG